MAETADPPAAALAWVKDLDQPLTYAALSQCTRVPASTLWHRKNGRACRRKAAAKRQYLTPSKEDGLEDYLLETYKRGFRVPKKLTSLDSHLPVSNLWYSSSTLSSTVDIEEIARAAVCHSIVPEASIFLKGDSSVRPVGHL